MTNLERAIKDGYAHIIGEKGKEKITYVSSDNHVENYSDPEEKVRAEFWAELIYKYEYPVNRIKIEVTVPDRLPTDRADIVVFRDDECKRPYAVVECKKDGVTDAEFNQAIEQGVGNATWVKLRADYVVIIAGGTRRVLFWMLPINSAHWSVSKTSWLICLMHMESPKNLDSIREAKMILSR